MSLLDEITGRNTTQKKKDDSKKTLLEEITSGATSDWEEDYPVSYVTPPKNYTAEVTPTPTSYEKDISNTVTYLTGKAATSYLGVVESIGDVGGWALKLAGRITSWLADNSVGEAIFGKDAGNVESNPLYQAGDTLIKNDITGTLNKKLDESVFAKKSYLGKDSLPVQVVSGVSQVRGLISTGNLFGAGKAVGELASTATKMDKILRGAKVAISNPTTKSLATSVFGSSYAQASNSGANDLESTTFGVLNLSKEVITELGFGGLGKAFGKGALDDVVKKGTAKVIDKTFGLDNLDDAVKNQIKSTFKYKAAQFASEVGLSAGFEGFEEVFSSLAQPFVDYVYTHNLDFESYDSLMNDFVVGALVSGVLQSASIIVDNEQSKKLTEIASELENNNLKKKLEKVYTQTHTIVSTETVPTEVKINRVNNTIDMLADQISEIAPLGTIDIDAIYTKMEVLRKQRDVLLETATEEEKKNTLNQLANQLQELSNVEEPNSVVHSIIEDKQKQVDKLTESLDKNKKIKVAENKQQVKANAEQNINEAIAFVDQMNATLPQGQPPINIILDMTPEQQQVADVASIFGKQVIFANNLPYSGAVSKANPNLLFIDTKPSSGLITNKQGAMLYTMGHELFHSLKMEYPTVYNEFIKYTKGNIEIQQIIDFVQKYDTTSANQLLEGLKIEGEFTLQEIINKPTKHKQQSKVLNTIVEEIVANEFGGMITDKKYMTKLSTDNKSLFDKIVKSIRNLFKSIKGSVYDSSLTQLQVEKIRTDFENIIKETQQKAEQKQTKVQETVKTETKETVQTVIQKETVQETKRIETKEEPTIIPTKLQNILEVKEKTEIKDDKGKVVNFYRLHTDAANIVEEYDYNQSTTSHVAGFGLELRNDEMYTKGKDEKNVIKTKLYTNKGMLQNDGQKIGFNRVERINKIANRYMETKDENYFGTEPIRSDVLIDAINQMSNIIANNSDNATGRKAWVEFYDNIGKDGYIKTEPDGSLLAVVVSPKQLEYFNNVQKQKKKEAIEAKKPVLPKIEDTTPVKKSTMSLEQRATAINANLDMYNKTTDPKRKTALKESLIKMYNNYLNDGGVEVIKGVAQWVESPEVKQSSTIIADSGIYIDPLLNVHSEKESIERQKQLDIVEEQYLNKSDRIKENTTSNEDIRYLPKDEATGKMKTSKTFKNALEDPLTNQNIIDAAATDPNYAQYKARVNTDDWQRAEERIRAKGLDAGTALFAKETEWTPVDLFTCYMLERYYGATGNPESELAMYELRKKKGTTFGQNLQAFNVLRGLTPTAIVYGVRRDLEKAIEAAAQSQDATMKQWVSDMKGRAILTRAEEEWLYQMGVKLQKLDPESLEYKRRENLIKLFAANKIPKAFWKKMKKYRRVAMLFNPKTIARNLFGNISMAIVNVPTDIFSGVADKIFSGKSNIRTGGGPDAKTMAQGFNEGIKEANEDARLGINTSQMSDWQEPEGDTWDNNTIHGKSLNWAEKSTNYLLDVTDRPLERMYYRNSLAVQMRLNNVDVPTETMKQIALYDAKRRTWKDEGKLFKHAQNFRTLLNHMGFKDGRFQLNVEGGTADFGLGDVVFPFIITPANLITAAFEYSPVGALTLMTNHKKFKEALASNNELEIAMAQKILSENYGKMITGTLLIAIASVFAKAGLTTGGEDDDEDVRQAMRNQGYQPFAFKVGDFTFAYDWLQPMASPFAIMAELERKGNIYQGTKKESSFLEFSRSVAEGFLIGGERMYEQSFLKGVQQLFSGDNPMEGLFTTLTNLPASFVPTLSKYIADTIDNTSKKTYDRQNPLYQIYGQAAARIPFLKSTLDSNVTTLGTDKKMYGDTEGFARAFHSIFNPSLVSRDISGDVGKEIMDVYNHTGEKSIFPQVAVKYMDYDLNGDGVVERVNFSNAQQSELQKLMGKTTAEGIYSLLRFDGYQNASYDVKAKAMISLIEYSKAKAIEQSGIIPNYEIKGGNALQINKYVESGLNISNAVIYDSLINPIESELDENGDTIPGTMNGMKAYEIMNLPTSDEYKNIMLRLIHNKDAKYWENVDTLSRFSSPQQFKDYYSLQRRDSMYVENFSRDDYDMATTKFNVNGSDFIKYVGDLGQIKSDVDAKGNTISNSKKNKTINYIQSLPLNQIQKIMMLKTAGYSVKQYQNTLYSYVNSLDITADEKRKIWAYLTE